MITNQPASITWIASLITVIAVPAHAYLGPTDETPHPPTPSDMHNDKIALIVGYTWIIILAAAFLWICWWGVRWSRRSQKV